MEGDEGRLHAAHLPRQAQQQPSARGIGVHRCGCLVVRHLGVHQLHAGDRTAAVEPPWLDMQQAKISIHKRFRDSSSGCASAACGQQGSYSRTHLIGYAISEFRPANVEPLQLDTRQADIWISEWFRDLSSGIAAAFGNRAAVYVIGHLYSETRQKTADETLGSDVANDRVVEHHEQFMIAVSSCAEEFAKRIIIHFV